MLPDKRQRLFFALWPDEALRRQLKQLLAGQQFLAAGGRSVPPENFHITLRYLSAISEPQRLCAERVADAMHADSFQLILDKAGYWRGPKVAWLGASDIPALLHKLVRVLETGLEPCGLEPETRSYQPHLTYLRKARPTCLPANFPSIVWQVDQFVLVHSFALPEGVRYEVVRSWSVGSR